MAKKSIFESDFSGRTGDEANVIVISMTVGRNVIVADAHPDDDVVKKIREAGVEKKRRGRRPKAES